MRDGGEKKDGSYLLETARLALRRQRAEDAIALQALAANPAIAPNLCSTIPPGDGAAMVIVERRTTRPIGAATHGPTGLGTGLEVALWIGEPFWERGYGTEAAQALVDYAFADPEVGVLWCSSRVTNPRGRRVIEKCGFQFRSSGMVRLPERGAFPIERFALDRRNWASLKSWGAGRAAPEVGDAPRETAA